MKQITRRSFLSLLSRKSIGALAIPTLLSNCGNFNNLIASPNLKDEYLKNLKNFPLNSLSPIASDNLELAEGLSHEILIKWNERISKKEYFGYNNDFTCFIPIGDNPNDGLLWVNHEYTNPLFVSGYDYYNLSIRRSIDQIDKEMKFPITTLDGEDKELNVMEIDEMIELKIYHLRDMISNSIDAFHDGMILFDESLIQYTRSTE